MADEVNTSQGMEYEIATADSGVVKSLDKLCDALNNVYKNLEKIEDASDDAFDAGKVDRMTNSLGKIADQLAAAAQRFDQSTERMLSAMEKSSKSSRKSTTRKSSKKSEREPAESNKNDINLPEEKVKGNKALDFQQQEVERLYEEYQKLTSKLDKSTSAKGIQTLRIQIESVVEQLNKAGALYDALAGKGNNKHSIQGYDDTMEKSKRANQIFEEQKKTFARHDISAYEQQIQSLLSKFDALSSKSVKTNLSTDEIARYQILNERVNELQRKLSELANTYKIDIDTSATEQAIASIQTRLEQLKLKEKASSLKIYEQAIDRLFEQHLKLIDKLNQATTPKSIATLRKQIDGVIEQLKNVSQLYDEAAGKYGNKTDIPGYSDTMTKSSIASNALEEKKRGFIQQDINAYEQQIQATINAYEQQIQLLINNLDALSNKSIKTNLNQSEITQCQELINQVRELQQRLSELAGAHQINVDTSATERKIASLQSKIDSLKYKERTDSLEIYKQEIDSLFEEYVKLTDKLGQSTSARGMEILRAQIESVIEQLNQMSRLYDAVASRSDDKASIPGYNETMAKSGLANDVFADQKKNFAKLDISEYEKQIQSLMSKLDSLSNKSVKTNLDQTEVTRYQELIRQVSELQLRLSELSKEHKINIDTSATEQQIASLQSQLNQIMSGGNSSTRRMKFSMSTLISMAKQLPSSFSRAFKTAHKIANVFSKIGRFISRCVKRISSFVKHLFKAKRNTTSLSREFKYFLRMLSSATLFRTFSKITDSMAEAKDALARISDTYNATLSKLQTSLNATRNAIVSAFAPIQSLFNGPFTSIMALIERAADKIGMAFAALNGQDVYEKLTQDAVNYRDTLEDVNKAQKQVIGGLDELNILQENKDKTDEFNFRVEYVTIDKGVSGIFKRIRDLWKSGEYKRTGEFIAEQINAWFSGLEIDDFFAPIKKATDNAITALNGFINKFDGALMGEQMGKFVTGLVDIMADIVENGEWDKFISKFGEAMKTFITSLPAERIGSMMGNVITIILDSILTIAEVLTDDEVVNQIILALETVIDKINEFFDDPTNVTRMGTTLGKLINGVVRIVNTITKKLNLSPILDALNLALETTDQGQLKSGIDNLTSIIEDAFTSDFVSNLAAIIAKGVLSAIETVLKYMVLGLVVIVESALNLLLTPFVGIIENVNKLLNLVGVDTSGIISPDFGVKSMWEDHAISKAIGIEMGIIEPEVKGNYIANPTDEQLETYRQQVGDEMYQKYLENVGKSNADSYIGGWNSGDWDSLVDGLMGDKMGGGKASQNGGAGFGATKHGGGGGAFEYGRSVADEYRRGFSSADWVQTGRFASDGIMQGMDSAFAGVQRWGRDFLAATQDVFMIASPSKLFRKLVGKFLGLGIALGLYDSTPAMLKSVDSASDSMIREFDKKPIRLNKFTARGSVSIPDTATSKIGGANNRAFDDRQDNNGVVGAIETMTYKIVDAVKEKTTDAYIDGQKVTDNVSARQSARVKMTGKPAMA